jgi:hypothetical protein
MKSQAKSQHKKGFLSCETPHPSVHHSLETPPYDPIVDETTTALLTRETYLRNPSCFPLVSYICKWCKHHKHHR